MKKADRRESKLLSALKKYFNGQKKRVLEKLTASQIKRKDIIDDILSIEVESGVAKKDLLHILMKFAEEAGKDAMELMGSDYNFRMSQRLQGLIDSRVDVFTKEITKTTKEQLKRALYSNLSDGGTITDLAKDIERIYGDISRGRAMVIARTETEVAVQSGQFEGYKQSGVEIKIWVAVMDDRTRDSHAEMDGEERPIDMPFSNGLMFPGDPDGEASEVINCRCTI